MSCPDKRAATIGGSGRPAGGAVVLLHKPPGVSSFSALSPLKRLFGTKKIGHAGTLDPFASGLLIGLVGYATKLAKFFSGLDKRYTAELRFGVETDTLDPEGITVATGPIPDGDAVKRAVGAFVGEIEQVPPSYSAVKVGGRRAYKAAREGHPVVPAPRIVTIHGLSLRSFRPPVAEIDVWCSKGTYVRSLVRDIAARSGTVAYTARLVRSAIGPFKLDEIGPEGEWVTIEPIAALERIGGIGTVRADESTVARIARGARISADCFRPPLAVDGPHAIIDREGRLVAVVELEGDRVSYRFVVPQD